jgi:integrase/recombinase XerD
MNTSYKEINKQYAVWLDTLGFADKVVYGYKNFIRDFLQWLETQQITQINQLTQRNINQYFNSLETRENKRKKGNLLNVSHLNQNFIAIDKLLEFLHAQGAQNAPTPTNYRLHVDNDLRVAKIQPLTQAEIKTLYDTILDTFPTSNFVKRERRHYELKLIFALYYGCGLRLSEGAQLQIQNVDFERKTIFVEKGKNYKDRYVPMSAGVYRDLQDYIYNFRNKLKLPHSRLFIHTAVTLHHHLKHLQSVCKDPQIQQKRIYIHLLRHSIATHLLENGMNPSADGNK